VQPQPTLSTIVSPHHGACSSAAYRIPDTDSDSRIYAEDGCLWSYPSFNPPLIQTEIVSTRFPTEHLYVVRALYPATVAVRGLRHGYGDETIIQQRSNGDSVRPKWGITKGRKPRKRLGQACNICREKKVRCDPGVRKCARCEKHDRECKFDMPSVILVP
jgi:hypothetical protein